VCEQISSPRREFATGAPYGRNPEHAKHTEHLEHAKATVRPEPYVPSAKASQPEAEAAAAKASRAAAPRTDQPATAVPKLKAVTITIDADSADVVRVEGLDAKGARHELSMKRKRASSRMLGARNDSRRCWSTRSRPGSRACS
jgi:hypothetical protein